METSACPLASSHTKETKGKGWKDGEVKAVAPPRIAKDNKVKGSFAAVKSNFRDAKKKCFCCGSLDHGIKDCPKKSEFAKFQASQPPYGSQAQALYMDDGWWFLGTHHSERLHVEKLVHSCCSIGAAGG